MMGNSFEWLDGFMKKFARRLDPPGWPEPGTDEYADFRDDWLYAVSGRSITEAEAVEAIRHEAIAKGQSGDRDTAMAASRNCPRCEGSGQVRVYDPRYDGRRAIEREVLMHGEVRKVMYPMYTLAHCVCPMGRWMRSKFRDLDTLSRIPDFAEVLAGRSRWVARNPVGDEQAFVAPRRRPDVGAVVARVKDGQVVA